MLKKLRPGRAEDFFYILPPPALIEIAFPAGNHAHKQKISAPAAGNFRTIILSNLIFGACSGQITTYRFSHDMRRLYEWHHGI